jgi:hypothetical protein
MKRSHIELRLNDGITDLTFHVKCYQWICDMGLVNGGIALVQDPQR